MEFCSDFMEVDTDFMVTSEGISWDYMGSNGIYLLVSSNIACTMDQRKAVIFRAKNLHSVRGFSS